MGQLPRPGPSVREDENEEGLKGKRYSYKKYVQRVTENDISLKSENDDQGEKQPCNSYVVKLFEKNLFKIFQTPCSYHMSTCHETCSQGITIKRTTERINVSYGTITLLTPRRNMTIGAKATKRIRSFTATCTRV